MNDSHHNQLFENDAELIEALGRLPTRSVPSGFAQATALRFQQAHRARNRRHFVASGVAMIVAASAMFWGILFNFTSVTIDVASTVGKFKALLNAFSVIWSTAPQFGVSVTFGLWLVVLACVGMLIRLSKKSALVRVVE